jgi:hypothetical protein
MVRVPSWTGPPEPVGVADIGRSSARNYAEHIYPYGLSLWRSQLGRVCGLGVLGSCDGFGEGLLVADVLPVVDGFGEGGAGACVGGVGGGEVFHSVDEADSVVVFGSGDAGVVRHSL